MTATVHGFQTEVTKLLNLLANSLYSNKEVFLRELISNASDAIDKLHFMSLTDMDLIKDDPVFKIQIRADKDSQTLTVSDNGLGMTLDEANANLGTIAKSGTEEFVKHLSGDQVKDSQLIGQFGVGFYSAFIVADRVTVISRSAKAPVNEGVRWTSEGNGTFESENIDVPARGTQVILHLKDDAKEFLDQWKLHDIIAKYSDHISTPVELYQETFEEVNDEEPQAANEGENAEGAESAEGTEGEQKQKETKPVWKYVQVNNAQALWTRPAKDISDDEYKSFYRHTFNDYSEPLSWSHNKVEGELEYTSLLYIPSRAPMEMMQREPHLGLKLYVQRVFIMEEDDQFLPSYLRFVRGLVDTNALPLNVSRELLQDSRVTRKLKAALTKRALGMIEKLSTDKEKYATFVANFNDVLKEGLYENRDHSEQLLSLIRFASTADTSKSCNVSLDDYISRMKDKQKHIYYFTADDYDKVVNSPFLERLKSKGIEVLLLWKQPIDDWFCSMLQSYKDHTFIAANAYDLDLGELEDEQDKSAAEETEKEYESLVTRFKDALGSQVESVRVSTLLKEVPACLVSKSTAFSFQMKMMSKLQGIDLPAEKGVLELNPHHPLVEKASQESNEAVFKDYAQLIFEQASLAANGELKNPSSFIALMNRLLLGTSGEAAPEGAPAAQAEATPAEAEPKAEEQKPQNESSIEL